jgi:hypothetical protein
MEMTRRGHTFTEVKVRDRKMSVLLSPILYRLKYYKYNRRYNVIITCVVVLGLIIPTEGCGGGVRGWHYQRLVIIWGIEPIELGLRQFHHTKPIGFILP